MNTMFLYRGSDGRVFQRVACAEHRDERADYEADGCVALNSTPTAADCDRCDELHQQTWAEINAHTA